MSSVSRLPQLLATALQRIPETAAYPRFQLDQVLGEQEYLQLLGHFPDWVVGTPGVDGYASFTLRGDVELPHELSADWKEFLTELQSPSLIDALVKTCYPYVLERYPLLWRHLLRSRLLNPSNYQLTITFSANFAGRFLPPHNDNSFKVLALVLYFAPVDYTGENEGTLFYRPHSQRALKYAIRNFNRLADSKITRYIPISLMPMTSANIHNGAHSDEDRRKNEKWFYENFDNDFNIEFSANRIAGFVKTQNSFHAVDMRESTYVGPRRSLLINLNLKHSVAARAWQSFRTRVLKLSS